MWPAPSINPVVIAPTFNNARTLAGILQQIDLNNLPVIVIDDGSTDATASILDTWSGAADTHTLLTHSSNQGKAAALSTGFVHALGVGFTHAITIDTDGQLNPAQIPELLQCAVDHPTALVLGVRDSTSVDYPFASRFGRCISNFLVRVESGARVADSQCGFRVYPLQQLRPLHCHATRYGFETEVLTRAAWAGVPIEQIPVECVYRLPDGRVTHFCPWRDSLRAVQMHLLLLLRSLLPWPFFRIADPVPTGTLFHRFAQWLSPGRAWRAIKEDPAHRPRFAAAVSVGVFIANLPLYGVQTVIGLYAARRFRLNPLAVVAGSHLSTPPVGPILIAAAIAVGHFLIHGVLPDLRTFNPAVMGYKALIKSVLLEWAVGSLVVGLILAGLAYVITQLALRCVPLHKPADQETDPGQRAPVPDRAVAKSAA